MPFQAKNPTLKMKYYARKNKRAATKLNKRNMKYGPGTYKRSIGQKLTGRVKYSRHTGYSPEGFVTGTSSYSTSRKGVSARKHKKAWNREAPTIEAKKKAIAKHQKLSGVLDDQAFDGPEKGRALNPKYNTQAWQTKHDKLLGLKRTSNFAKDRKWLNPDGTWKKQGKK